MIMCRTISVLKLVNIIAYRSLNTAMAMSNKTLILLHYLVAIIMYNIDLKLESSSKFQYYYMHVQLFIAFEIKR